MDNFAGRDKVLYVIDSLEEDDAFYLYEQDTLRKQSGYYIYYTRNEAMQNYMISQKDNLQMESDELVEERDQDLIRNYRQVLQKRTHAGTKTSVSYLYIASSFLTVAFLALGITVLKNYDRMRALEVNLQRVSLAVEGTDTSTVEEGKDITNVIKVDANISETETDDTQASDTEEGTEDSVETLQPQNANSETTAQTNTAEPTPEVYPASTGGNPLYYTVQAGDTLSSISCNMYHSYQYIDKIMEANGLENGDEIYEGQQIMIPSMN